MTSDVTTRRSNEGRSFAGWPFLLPAAVAAGADSAHGRGALGGAQLDLLSQHDKAGLRALGVLRGMVSAAA